MIVFRAWQDNRECVVSSTYMMAAVLPDPHIRQKAIRECIVSVITLNGQFKSRHKLNEPTVDDDNSFRAFSASGFWMAINIMKLEGSNTRKSSGGRRGRFPRNSHMYAREGNGAVTPARNSSVSICLLRMPSSFVYNNWRKRITEFVFVARDFGVIVFAIMRST
jgi:hypothetical protein